jgi:O-antigen ligase
MEVCRWILLPLTIYALVLLVSAREIPPGARSLLLAGFAVVGSFVLLTAVVSQMAPRPSKAFVAIRQ